MGRLVLTVLALVFVTCVVADYDSHERGNRRGTSRNDNDDRRHDDRGHDDRRHDDRGLDDRRHDDRGHDDRRHDDRGHDDRLHDDRRHDDRGHDDRHHDDRRHGDRRNGERGHDDRGHDDRGHDDRGHDDRGHDDRRHDNRRHGHRGHDDKGHNYRHQENRSHEDKRHHSSEESIGSNENHSGLIDDSKSWDALSDTDAGNDEEKDSLPEEPIKIVKMPSGDQFNITSPNATGWTCDKRKTELVDLEKSEAEYNTVANEMEKTKADLSDCATNGGCVKKYDIIKIQKIINGCLWTRFREKQQMMQIRDKTSNEMMLFHGTSAVDSIISVGFDERYSSLGPLGAGLYFVTSSSVANQYVFPKTETNRACTDCERRLILSRVSLGKVFELDKQGDDVKANEFGYAPMGYTSVMAKKERKTYNEYAVYRGDEAYPEYLITYKIISK